MSIGGKPMPGQSTGPPLKYPQGVIIYGYSSQWFPIVSGNPFLYLEIVISGKASGLTSEVNER